MAVVERWPLLAGFNKNNIWTGKKILVVVEGGHNGSLTVYKFYRFLSHHEVTL